MILRRLILVVALGIVLASPLFADTARGNRLLTEGGGVEGITGTGGPLGSPGAIGLVGFTGIADIAAGMGIAGMPGMEPIPAVPNAPGILDYSDFYALMPNDNPNPLPGGQAITFPYIGSSTGVIIPADSSMKTFLLPRIGSYIVLFQASVMSPGQLMLRLNGMPIANSVVGNEFGLSGINCECTLTANVQLVGVSVITTLSPNNILEVINPIGNSNLTLPGNVGGVQPVSAHLVIVRIF